MYTGNSAATSAAAEEALARREAAAAAQQSAAPAPGPLGLTREQLWMAVGFATVVFAGITILLIVAAGK